MKTLNEAKLLKETIKGYDKAYYELGESIISDNEYDRLYEEYLELENNYPELKNAPDALSKKVGAGNDAGTTSGLPKFTHKTPLLSIDKKSRELNDLKKFYEDCGGDGVEVIVEPKLDGITCNINYENGKFTNAATRGNGYIGDLVTENFTNTDTIYPKMLNSDIFEVRGEAIIPYNKFKSYLSQDYSNPRNAVAGLMRSKDSKDVKDKHIQVMFYDVGHENFSNGKITKDSEYVDVLKNWGFQSVPTVICDSWEKLSKCVEENFNHMITDIDGFNVLKTDGYPEAVCDGLVIKVNSLQLRNELGFSLKGPKWAYAYKFKPLRAKTKIEKVEWQVGKSGRICPVAVFRPITLGGTIITRATLNNYDYMSHLPIFENDEFDLNTTQKLNLGDTIIVERSNDVIPRIVAKEIIRGGNWECCDCTINELNKELSETFKEPLQCPVCGEHLVKEGPLHYCKNPLCPAQVKGRIEHFANRDAMNIVGLGEGIIETLYEQGLLKNIPDIYNLPNRKEELLKLEGFKEKKVNNLIKSIEGSKNPELWQFLYALSIPNIGKRASKDIVAYFGNLEDFFKASKDELLKIENFAETTADGILKYTQNNDFKKMVFEDLSMIKPKEIKKVSDVLQGKSFVITGTLKHPRNYYVDLIESLGGKVSNGVSKKTYAVLIGADAGSKETKARELVAKGAEIKILDTEEKINELFRN